MVWVISNNWKWLKFGTYGWPNLSAIFSRKQTKSSNRSKYVENRVHWECKVFKLFEDYLCHLTHFSSASLDMKKEIMLLLYSWDEDSSLQILVVEWYPTAGIDWNSVYFDLTQFYFIIRPLYHFQKRSTARHLRKSNKQISNSPKWRANAIPVL